jgi:hypothetical protein
MVAIQMDLCKAELSNVETIISWIPNKLMCKYWAGPKVRYPLSIETLTKDIEFSDSNSYCLIDSDALVAFGQLLKKEKNHLHLARIIVNPSARKMGYGKLFCHKLLQIADGTGWNQRW